MERSSPRAIRTPLDPADRSSTCPLYAAGYENLNGRIP